MHVSRGKCTKRKEIQFVIQCCYGKISTDFGVLKKRSFRKTAKFMILDLWFFYDFGVSKKQCFWWREFMILKNKFFLKKLVTPSSKTSRFPISIRKFSPPSGAILISFDRLPNECLRFLIFVAISNNNSRTYFPVGKHKLSKDLDHQNWFNERWSVSMPVWVRIRYLTTPTK